MNPAVFFDRDGVLNELVQRDGGWYSPRSIDQFNIIKSSKNVINKLKEMGFLIIVVSNQPDISRGDINTAELDKMTNALFSKLKIDDIFYCPHDDSDLCICRKPSPGLLIKASDKWNIDLEKSYMIGDTWKDAEAAKNANIKFLLINKNYNLDCNNVIRIDTLNDTINLIESY